MPIYEVTEPKSGRVLELTGDTPPTEKDLDELFAQYKDAPAPKGIIDNVKGAVSDVVDTMGKAFTSYAGLKQRTTKPALEVPATLTTGAISLVPAVGSMLVPTPERVQELKKGKIESDVGKELNARLERARLISDITTYQPKSEAAQTIVEPVGKAFGYLPEKAKQSREIYLQWAEDEANKGNYAKATAYKTIADTIEPAAEATNLYLLGKAGEGMGKGIKAGAKVITPPDISLDLSGRGKPTSLTAEITREKRVSPEFTKSVLEPKDNVLQIEQKKDFSLADKNAELIDAQTERFAKFDKKGTTSKKQTSPVPEPPKEAPPKVAETPPVKTLQDSGASVSPVTAGEVLKGKEVISGKPSEIPKPIETPDAFELKSRVFDRLKAEHPEALEGDLTYNKINLEKDAEIATGLIETDRNQAYRLAMNMEASPNVTNTAVNIAMSEKALKDGNLTLYSKLVKNRSLAQTRRGQEIVSEKGSVTDNSTSRYVRELVSTRLEKLGSNFFDDLKGRVSKKSSSNKSRGIDKIDREVQRAQQKTSNKLLDIKEAQSLIDKLMCK